MACSRDLESIQSHPVFGPRTPDDESARLQSLNNLRILDTDPNPAFDQLIKLASEMFSAPIAFVSFIDDSRQWFKSRHGSDLFETRREAAFCAHTILADRVTIIFNTSEDQRFRLDPLVCGDPGIRFYADAPITTAEGHRVESLRIIDTVPRKSLNVQREA